MASFKCNACGRTDFYTPHGFANHKRKCKGAPPERSFAGYSFQAGGGTDTKVHRKSIDTSSPGDYGADPLGDGRFRMVPSGDIVDFDERNRRLKR